MSNKYDFKNQYIKLKKDYILAYMFKSPYTYNVLLLTLQHSLALIQQDILLLYKCICILYVLQYLDLQQKGKLNFADSEVNRMFQGMQLAFCY